MKGLRICVYLFCLFAAALARADLTIEITRGRDDPTTIAVVPFGWTGSSALSEDVAAIVASDMERSGQFAPLGRGSMLSLPQESREVFFRDWRALGVEYLLIGRIQPNPTGLLIQYELFDVNGQRSLMQEREVAYRDTLRDAGHRIADRVYERLTGVRGAFSTKLLYVSSTPLGPGRFTYRLMLSDIDGARERVLREQSEPILTPVWAPDGETIAYVSFETTRPAIFMHNLRTGRREQLTDFPGLNGAPAWSPDGRRLAMVLSKDGAPNIYMLDVATRELTQLTRHFAIDTEPTWMPDGKSILFTSDRGGQPQIYRVDVDSAQVERVTFRGNYNARARALPDGSGMVMVHRDSGGGFHIALMEFRRNRLESLTQTTLDESPSIAPNGTMVIYATTHNGRGILSAVSVDGGVRYRLPSSYGDVRDPAWSPFAPLSRGGIP